MPVNSTHKQYKGMSDAWMTMRDVMAGEPRIHERGEAYLPRLDGQDAKEYGAYVHRASFYNATQRTVDGLSGMIFRKAPVVEIPTAMEEWAEDVTLDGLSLTNFAESLVEEQLVVSRAGVLVDFPPGGENTTRAQAEAENRRPYIKLYQAETITDWQSGHINNRTQLTQVRLKEKVEVPSQDDPFERDEIEQYRVLDLITEMPVYDDEGKFVEMQSVPLQYRQQVWRMIGAKWEVVEEITPQMNGSDMDFIPFVFIGPRGTQWEVSKPILLDLANANLSHYRTVADLEHGAHFTALPTPYVFGVDDDHVPTAIGPTELWHGPNGEVSVGLLEFTGSGLETLEKRRESKEQHMASLGARMLAPEKRQAETAEAVGIKHSGETSMLASLSQAISTGLTEALMIARDWMGLAGDVKIELNTDFMPQPMSPEMLKQLMAAWQSSGIAFEDLHYQLQRGEIVREDRTAEDVQADTQDETPPMPEPTTGGGEE